MSDSQNIRCVLNFGKHGQFAINFELKDKDLHTLQTNRFKDHSVSEVIRQVAIEYLIGLRTTVEQANPNFNYDYMAFVNVDGQKIDAKEIHKIMMQKTEHLTRHMN